MSDKLEKLMEEYRKKHHEKQEALKKQSKEQYFKRERVKDYGNIASSRAFSSHKDIKSRMIKLIKNKQYGH